MSQTSSTSVRFESSLHRWGRLTMSVGFLISIGAPVYLFLFHDLFPDWSVVLIALVGVAALFAVNWVVEPLTYFPMLGASGTYQAWLVGNISNKLLPAAITAQAAVGTRQGTRRGEIVAIHAISCAVIVHVISLVVLVALGGQWIMGILPERFVEAFDYILPAILGPVFVQLAFTIRNPRSIAFAILSGMFATLVMVPLVPAAAPFALPVAVVLAVTLALVLRKKEPAAQVPAEAGQRSEG